MTAPALSRPPWLGRALIEAGLIVFAVVLGFLVNEWREGAAHRASAGIAMGRVAAEIDANIAGLESVVGYHEEVLARIDARIAALQDAREADAAAPEGVLFDELALITPRGVNAPGLSRFAWNHAQEHGRLDVLPYDTVARTARVYALQANGVESTWRLIVELLFSGPELMRSQDIVSALRFTRSGFQELSNQERHLIGELRRVREQLREQGY
jgi:hypothetical protein